MLKFSDPWIGRGVTAGPPGGTAAQIWPPGGRQTPALCSLQLYVHRGIGKNSRIAALLPYFLHHHDVHGTKFPKRG